MLYPNIPSGDEEEVKDDDPLKEREMLIGVVRLLNSDSAEDKRRARRYLEAKHQNFTDEDLEQFGLKRPEKDDRSLFEKAAGLPGVKTAMSVVGTAGGVLGRVGEFTQRQLQQTGQTIGDVGNATINAAVPGAPQGGGISLADVPGRWHERQKDMAKATTDITGKSDLNTRSMLGLDKNAGGTGWFGDYVVGGLDLAGELATDPLSYVGTAGATQGTRIGLEGLERAAATVTGKSGFRGMVEHAGVQGAQEAWGLSDETMKAINAEALRDLTARGADAGVGQRGRILSKLGAEGPKKGGPWTRFVDDATAAGAGAKGSMKGLSGEARVAQRHLNLAAMRGQKGLKFGNQTVIPSNSWRAPFAKHRLVKSTRIVDNPELRRVVRDAEDYDEQIANAQKEVDRLSADPQPNGRTLQSIETWEKKLAVLVEERADIDDELGRLREAGVFDEAAHIEPNPAYDEAAETATPTPAELLDAAPAPVRRGDIGIAEGDFEIDLAGPQTADDLPALPTEGNPQADAARRLEENAAKQAEYDRMADFYRQTEEQIDAQYAASDKGLEATNLMEAQSAELERFEDEMNILGGELLMPEQVEELTRLSQSIDTTSTEGIGIGAGAAAPAPAPAAPAQPPSVTREAPTAEVTELEARLADVEKRRARFQKGLDKANERANLQTPTILRDRIDEARAVIAADEALDAEAKALRARIKQAKAAEATSKAEAGVKWARDEVAKMPDDGVVFEPGQAVTPEGKNITAKGPDGKPMGSVDYYIDDNGVVQIDNIVVLDRRKGLGKRLVAKMEEETGQPMSSFGSGEGIEPEGEAFFKWRTGKDVDPVTRQPIEPKADEAAKASTAPSWEADAKRLKELVKGRAPAADRKATKAKLADLEERLAKIEGPRQQKLQKNLDKMEVLTGKKNSLIEQAERMPEVIPQSTPSRFLKTSRTLENLKEAFVTHNPVRQGHGKRAAEILGTSQEAAKGFAKHYGEDALASFENTTSAIVHEDGVSPGQWADELRTRVMPALEREGGSEELYDEFLEEGRQASADWLENYDRVRFGITDDLVRQGKIPAEFMHDPHTYVMRLLEPAAKEALEAYLKKQSVAGEMVGKPNQLAGELTQGGAMDERTFRTDLAGDELNAEAAAEYDREIAPGWGDKPVYRQDPVLSASVKAHLAGQQIGTQGLLDSLLGEFDDVGRPLMTTDKTVAKSLKYVPLSSTTTAGAGATYYAPKAIADDVSRFQAVIVNDDSIAKASSMMEKVQKLWKAHATVPLIGAAFHMRNGQTNVILNWSAGMGLTAMPFYAKAAKLQNRAWDAAHELGKDPNLVTIDDILNASGKLSKDERRILQQARKHNIFGSSFVSTDLSSTGGRALEQRAVPQSKARRALGKLNPFDLNNFFGIKSGHAVAGAIENNARLAHFMWAMDKFGDAETAAMSVKKYLFNYDDLTDFEKTVMKKWIPFYTFMRKNAGTVAQTLVENPGKVNRYLMAEKLSEDPDAAFLKGQNIPGYQLLGGMAARDVGPANVVLGMESPFSAAANTAAPFVQAAGETPGLNRLVPQAMKNPEGKKGALRELLNIPGGPVPEAIGVAAEHAFDVNTFTGGDKPRQDLPDKIIEALGIIAPSPSKVNRTVDNLTLGKYKDVEGEERTSRRTASIINLLLGLNAAGVGPVSSEKAFEGQWRSYIEDWIEQQNENLDPEDPEYIPTLAIIQEIMGKNLPPGGLRKGGRATPSMLDLFRS